MLKCPYCSNEKDFLIKELGEIILLGEDFLLLKHKWGI